MCSAYDNKTFCHTHTWAWRLSHTFTHTNAYIPIQTYMHILHMHIYNTASIHTHVRTLYVHNTFVYLLCCIHVPHTVCTKAQWYSKLTSGFSTEASQNAAISSLIHYSKLQNS